VRPREPAGPGGPRAEAAADLSRRLVHGVTDWMAGRALTATSLSGIALALGLCAAGWFAAGTRPDNISGVLAVVAGYLAILAARRLADPAELSGAADPAGARQAWQAGLGTRIFEYVVLAGLTVGAAAQGWSDMWPLGIGVLSLVSIHETMTACSAARLSATGSGSDRAANRAVDRARQGNRAALAVLTMPLGGRILVIAVVAPLWGARAVLVGLLDWAIIGIGMGIVLGSRTRRGRDEDGGRRPFRRRDGRPSSGDPRTASAEPSSLAVLFTPTRPVPPPEAPVMTPGREPISVLRMELTAPPPPSAQDTQELWLSDLDEAARADGEGPGRWDYDTGQDYGDADAEPPGGGVFRRPGWEDSLPAGLAVIAACRDDGVISRWVGGLVRGQLTPLPPALVALTAVALLAHLGLRDLPGFLTLAPPIMMLVAAPGASHFHDGRVDWLVPAVLQGAQYIYISALGFASGVPAAVTFLLVAAVAVRYADLGSPGSPPSRRPEWLGWEGRMLVCGLGAAMGVAMFAYLALAAYLAFLLGSKVVKGYSGSQEGD